MEEIEVNEKHNFIHMFSGGLDSTCELLRLALEMDRSETEKRTVWPLFIDYGQFAAWHEWACVNRIVAFIRARLDDPTFIRPPLRMCLRSDLFTWCRNVAFTGVEVGDEDCEIQNRNIILLSAVSSYLRACARNQGIENTEFEIHTGFKEREMADASRDFFETLEELLTEQKGDYTIRIKLLGDLTRGQTYTRLKKLLKGSQQALNELLELTTSCYSPRPNGKPCGQCWKCKRIAALKLT